VNVSSRPLTRIEKRRMRRRLSSELHLHVLLHENIARVLNDELRDRIQWSEEVVMEDAFDAVKERSIR